jgi:hypothetical protein
MRGYYMLKNMAHKPRFNRKLLLFTAGWITVSFPVLSQRVAAPSAGGAQIAELAAKVPAFDVVSVRPNKSGNGFKLTYTPNGFTTINMPRQLSLDYK